MKKTLPLLLLAALAASAAFADDKPKADEKAKAEDKPKAEAKSNSGEKPKAEDKQMSGISILGNQDSPNSLNDRAAPVDRDVFSRQLRYYAIRVGGAGN